MNGINYICTLLNIDSLLNEFLVCDNEGLKKLVDDADCDRYRLTDVQVLIGPVSHDVYDYVKK